MTPTTLFILLAFAGLSLVLVEVFMPGAVLGVIGALLLLAAAGVSFSAFGPMGGVWASLGLLICAGGVLFLWLRLFPTTVLGKVLTLRDDTPGKANPDETSLLGETGESLSNLRPSGLARIAGTKRDVLAESGWVDAGRKIKVVKVEASRILVREVES